MVLVFEHAEHIRNMTLKKVEFSVTLSKREKKTIVLIAFRLFLNGKLIVLEKSLNESLNLFRATSNPQKNYRINRILATR
jgi:hypothetical protein